MTSVKKRWFAVLAMVFVGAVAGVVVWPKEKEPECDGKKLSEWLAMYLEWGGGPLGANPADRVHRIGTNALPYLLRWIKVQRPAWEVRLGEKVLPRVGGRYASGKLSHAIVVHCFRRALAIKGFEILGDQGGAAIPDLLSLANEGRHRDSNLTAAVLYAFSAMGEQGCGPLMAIATNRAFGFQFQNDAVFILGLNPNVGTNADAVVTFLIGCLHEDDLSERAAHALGSLALDELQATPALINRFESENDSTAVEAIKSVAHLNECFVSRSRPLLRVIRTSTNRPGDSTELSNILFLKREAATNALRQVAPEVWKRLK